MLTITEQIPDFATYEEYLGYRSGSALFFDIETTGLSPAAALVFLIGIVRKHGDGWQLVQWIVQRPEDEPALLRAFFEAAAPCDTLIHFNGTTFDLPFLRERARRVFSASPDLPEGGNADKSPESLPPLYDLSRKSSCDLYQKFRPLKKALGLPRMNQTTLEQFLGFPREDRLSGKQMIQLFQSYTASQEPLLGDLLLLHNHDDLLGMTALLRLCVYTMLLDGQFASVHASVRHDGLSCEEACPSLELRLTLNAALPRALSLSAPCAALSAEDMHAVLSVPGTRGELRHFFPNYRDYYYLPLEDQAIHKSVAAFVDPEYRTRAKADNCYIKKSGFFFPQPEEIFSPAFQSSRESGELFFACPESGSAFFSEPESIAAYAGALLRSIARRQS